MAEHKGGVLGRVWVHQWCQGSWEEPEWQEDSGTLRDTESQVLGREKGVTGGHQGPMSFILHQPLGLTGSTTESREQAGTERKFLPCDVEPGSGPVSLGNSVGLVPGPRDTKLHGAQVPSINWHSTCTYLQTGHSGRAHTSPPSRGLGTVPTWQMHIMLFGKF